MPFQGTRLELQFKEGRLDFLPLMNLLLFSAKMSGQWVAQLNFPPLQDQLVELNRREQLVRSSDGDIDRLSQRWSRVVSFMWCSAFYKVAHQHLID